ncbi:MAG: PVC-type heme-binding CxxCH protein [Planctomycetota bacterium]|jgi:putative membrane-bound dehydrogenase-like protein
MSSSAEVVKHRIAQHETVRILTDSATSGRECTGRAALAALALTLGLACTARAETLRVDVGHAGTLSSSDDLQSGFEGLSAANRDGRLMGRAARTCSKSFAGPLGVEGRVTVTLDAPHDAWPTLAFRDRGDMSGELADLAEDFVFNEARLRLTLTGLKTGLYAVTTWHHDARYVGGMIDVCVGPRTAAGGLAQTTGPSTVPASAVFTVEADGVSPVVVEISSQSNNDAFVAYLNGFSLTPVGLVAAFDVDLPAHPITQATGGCDGGPFTSLRIDGRDPQPPSCSGVDRGVRMTVAGADLDAFSDQGIDGPLAPHPQAGLLRDLVRIESTESSPEGGRLTVSLEGLRPGASYLLTWYACQSSSEERRPMFVYQDRVARDTLGFTNVDDLLYTKENELRGEASLENAANTFLAAANGQGEIHLIAGRGAAVGSDDPADGTTHTVLNGLTVASAGGLPETWLADFAARPKVGGPTAANPSGDSLAKDYSSEVELIPPTEPEEAEATFEVEPGFRIELVAAEPMVMDPVCMSFDERGRLFVAEMRGYNQGNRVPCSEARQLALETEKLGRVKLLEDTDGDGRFDKSTVYVDDLIWPNGVMAYQGGVFVAASPEMLYCKDTDGDGVADVRRVVFTGFGYSNWQHLPNSFRWGLDNRIHGAAGAGGGDVACPASPAVEPVSLRGRDFAFDPRTFELAATNSSAQFGLSFDQWGNKFLTSNSDHILLVYFNDRYIARNRLLAAPRSWGLIAAEGRGADVFRISPPEPHRVIWMRMRATGVIHGIIERGGAPTGYITAAGGTTVYRGHAWPAEYLGNSFTPECSGNLVHRNVLEPDGVGQIARRADRGREFLASRDIWFRPVNMLNGPDGNLYLADMYRQVINEGVVLPPTLRKCFDLTEGCRRGRIYRVVPEGFRQPSIPRLDEAKTSDLVALLEHPNCWHYTTAARLLYERQDPAAVEPLVRLGKRSPSPLGRMHAMYALDGLRALSPEVILPRLADEHPRVREHAVRLAERVLGRWPSVGKRLLAMTSDDDLRVRYQLAFTLGEIPGPQATAALAEVAARDAGDPWFRLAVLSSSAGRAGDLFARLAADPSWRSAGGSRSLLEQLAEQAGLHASKEQVDRVVRSMEGFAPEETALTNSVVRGLLGGLRKVRSPLLDDVTSAGGSVFRRAVVEMFNEARRRALDSREPVERRMDAIRSLGLGPYDESGDVLFELFGSREPPEVAVAAVQAIGQFPDVAVAGAIIDAWDGLTPRLRDAATEVLFARRERLPLLLAAVDDGLIQPSQLDPARIQFLLSHSDRPIRDEASRLLGEGVLARREEAVSAYREALEMTGEIGRGRAVFKTECSKCHRLEGVGYDLGLPLSAIKDRGKEGILLNVLDPNRNINPQYVNYVVVTDDGRSVTGMIAAEAANSITLQRAEGESDTVLRMNIDELVDTGMSIMPEGLEKQLSRQDMADLIEYLMSLE